jgi:geranylgeranyl pyrophosphate synthase
VKELELLDLVQEDLQRVEQKMRAMGEGAYGPLAGAFLQLLGSGGKRLRPALALAAYGLFAGRASEKTVALAAAVETLQSATLVHDDLIDGALLRRGNTTLNAVWGKGATVLAGDYLFARAAGFAAETENIRVVQLFADTLRIICEGELRQLFSSHQWLQSKDAYYPRIFAKTASLFAAATRSGAILGAESQAGLSISVAQEQALYDYGHYLGMAFQIVDDILDYTSDEAVLGKPVGGDLRQGIVTLPLFYFLQSQPDPGQVAVRLDVAITSRDGAQGFAGDGIAEMVSLVRSSGAIERAFEEARSFANQARSSLALFPESSYRQALDQLADFVVFRHL